MHVTTEDENLSSNTKKTERKKYQNRKNEKHTQKKKTTFYSHRYV